MQTSPKGSSFLSFIQMNKITYKKEIAKNQAKKYEKKSLAELYHRFTISTLNTGTWLQIREGIWKYFSYFSTKTYVVCTH